MIPKQYHSFDEMIPDLIKAQDEGVGIDITVRLLEMQGYRCLRDCVGVDKNHSIACYTNDKNLLFVAHQYQKHAKYAEYVDILGYVPIKKYVFSANYNHKGDESA